MKKIFLLNGFVVLLLIITSGCASIVDGGRKKVRIDSNPPGALVTVANDTGETIISTNTPAVVRLTRAKGYFQGEHYTVKFDLPGYYPSEIGIKSQMNGWYLGNIMFGGAIGFLLVDPATGAMWTLSPSTVNRNLIATSQNLTPDQLKAAEEAANPPPKYVSANIPKGNAK